MDSLQVPGLVPGGLLDRNVTAAPDVDSDLHLVFGHHRGQRHQHDSYLYRGCLGRYDPIWSVKARSRRRFVDCAAVAPREQGHSNSERVHPRVEQSDINTKSRAVHLGGHHKDAAFDAQDREGYQLGVTAPAPHEWPLLAVSRGFPLDVRGAPAVGPPTRYVSRPSGSPASPSPRSSTRASTRRSPTQTQSGHLSTVDAVSRAPSADDPARRSSACCLVSRHMRPHAGRSCGGDTKTQPLELWSLRDVSDLPGCLS